MKVLKLFEGVEICFKLQQSEPVTLKFKFYLHILWSSPARTCIDEFSVVYVV